MSQEQVKKEGGLNRTSKELIFVNDLWDLINLKFDAKACKQSSKIEVEILIEVLSTILNPLICLESQAYAVQELRIAIAASYVEKEIQVYDSFNQVSHSEL